MIYDMKTAFAYYFRLDTGHTSEQFQKFLLIFGGTGADASSHWNEKHAESKNSVTALMK